jgi:hypothetical protein
VPIEDLAEGILRFVGRVIAQIFVDIVFEILIKGPGYFFMRLSVRFGAKEPDPDGFAVAIAGILFWAIVGLGAYFLYRAFTGLDP